jgi:hypothetical protein
MMSERSTNPSTLNWRTWYEKHKDEHNERRRQRYKEDAEYREAQQANAREQKRRLSERVPEGRIRLRYKRGTVLAYRVSHVASLIEEPIGSFRTWEREELIPPPIFSHPDRAYTGHQVVLLGEFANELRSDVTREKKELLKQIVWGGWHENIEYDD